MGLVISDISSRAQWFKLQNFEKNVDQQNSRHRFPKVSFMNFEDIRGLIIWPLLGPRYVLTHYED